MLGGVDSGLFGVVPGEAELGGARSGQMGDLPEGLVGATVPRTRGPHGELEGVGLSPGSVAFGGCRGPCYSQGTGEKCGKDSIPWRHCKRVGSAEGRCSEDPDPGDLETFQRASL